MLKLASLKRLHDRVEVLLLDLADEGVPVLALAHHRLLSPVLVDVQVLVLLLFVGPHQARVNCFAHSGCPLSNHVHDVEPHLVDLLLGLGQ